MEIWQLHPNKLLVFLLFKLLLDGTNTFNHGRSKFLENAIAASWAFKLV
jgi:hypothetical protein